jgi:toxin ParE1/3/4
VAVLRFLDSARDDLVDIAAYTARAGGDDVAARFTGDIIAKCEHIAALAGLLGRARPELRPDMRSTPFKNYLIFFRYLPSPAYWGFWRTSRCSMCSMIRLFHP